MSQVLTEQYTLPYYSAGLHDTFINLSTEDEAMMLNHRVRVYQVVIDLHNAGDPTTAEFNNGTYYIGHGEDSEGWSTQAAAQPFFADEREICTLRDMSIVASGHGNTIFSLFSAGPVSFRLDFGLDIEVTLTAGVPTGWSFGTAYVGANITSDPDGATQLAGATIIINGHSLDLYESAGLINTTTGSIVVTPVEWWPYAPTSGGSPIFDSATGAQINPNVVID